MLARTSANGWQADIKERSLRAKGNDMPTRLMGTLLVCFSLWAPFPAHAQSAAPTSAPPSPTDEITVVGARPERAETSVPLGSRIAREPLPTFSAVASTNVAGLTPGSGMDPFAGGTRFVSETICRSDNPRLSAEAACRLLPIQRLVAAGNYEEALSALDRFATIGTATDEERYVAAALRYRIAAARAEPLDREEALRAMLATAAMPADSRPSALRTLVALALGRGDSGAASGLLVELLTLVPDDTRSLVNLAAIRADAGSSTEAAALVRRAIEVARSRGEPVPAEWLSFATATPR
jgi:hypothetical protein